MTRETRVCAWKECDEEYTPATSNQIYHSQECQRLATNARIMAEYYERKNRRSGAVRICTGVGCQTILSRYNDSKKCAKCASLEDKSGNEKLLESLGLWESKK